MMPALQGEAGRPGNPSRLPVTGLETFGVHGNGTLQIVTREGTLSEALVWSAEERSQLADSGSVNWNHPPMTPQRSGLQTDTLPELPAKNNEALREAPGEHFVRLAGPVQFVSRLLEFWRLETRDAAGLLGFDAEDSDHVAAILRGREPIRGRDIRDRISHLFWIRKTLHFLFQDLGVENEWLREPHSMLDDRSPLTLLLGGSMEDLLLAREYVDAVAGR